MLNELHNISYAKFYVAMNISQCILPNIKFKISVHTESLLTLQNVRHNAVI